MEPPGMITVPKLEVDEYNDHGLTPKEEVPESNAPASSKRRRTDLDVSQKVELLDRAALLGPCSQRKAAETLNISRTFLRKLLKEEKELRREVEWWGGNGQKRKRHGKDREVEEGLLHWLEHLRSRDEKVNGRMLCRKAEEIAERLGRIDFKATDGWFARWKRRHGLTLDKCKRSNNKGCNYHSHPASAWGQDEPIRILKTFPADSVYNITVTAVSFRALPPYERKGPSSSSTKRRKADQLTIMAACSMDGKKEKLFVVGTEKEPRSFRGVKFLPIEYYYSDHALVTPSIWSDVIRRWNDRLLRENRRILVLVNDQLNISSSNLSHLEVRVVPENTRQPLDPDLAGMLKTHFRLRLDQLLSDLREEAGVTAQREGFDYSPGTWRREFIGSVSTLDACHLLAEAWHAITPLEVTSKWTRIFSDVPDDNQDDSEKKDDRPILLPGFPLDMSPNQFCAWVHVDDCLAVTRGTDKNKADEEALEEIVSNIVAPQPTEVAKSCLDVKEMGSNLSSSDMRQCLRRLRCGLETRGFQDWDTFHVFQEKVNRVITANPIGHRM